MLIEMTGDYHAVEEGLAYHPAGSPGDKSQLGIQTYLVGKRGIQTPPSIRIGMHDKAHHLTEVVPDCHKFLSKKIQCLRMRDVLVFGEIVNRFVNTTPHELGPKTVYEVLGKITVTGMGNQFRQLGPHLAGLVKVSLDIETGVLPFQFGIRIESGRATLARSNGNRCDCPIEQTFERGHFTGYSRILTLFGAFGL